MNENNLNQNVDQLIASVCEELGEDIMSRGEKGYGLFHRHRYSILAKKFLELKTDAEQNFLEIGSYNCFVPLLAKKIGYNVSGIDLPIFVKEFKDQESKFNLKIKWILPKIVHQSKRDE